VRDGPARVEIRCYGELGDFLSEQQRQRTLVVVVTGPMTVWEVVQSLGIPHPEVGMLVADGHPIGFDHPVRHGMRLAAYPAFCSLDLGESVPLRPPLGEEVRFALDVHLGRLASRLRLLGFDALYRNDLEDDELARVGAIENRVVLTRDRALLMRRIVVHGRWVRAVRPEDQVVEVVERFALTGSFRPFSRCMRCNGLLRPVPPEAVDGRVPEDVVERTGAFVRCDGCGRIYWEGTHHAALARWVAQMRARWSPP